MINIGHLPSCRAYTVTVNYGPCDCMPYGPSYDTPAADTAKPSTDAE